MTNRMVPHSVAQLYVRNGKSVSANKGFTELTGFSLNEIRDQELSILFKDVLKSSWHPNNFALEKAECYIFTKAYDVKRVMVSIEPQGDVLCVTFIEKSIPYLHGIAELLVNIYNDGETGFMVLCAKELLLLKANKFLTDYINVFYDDSQSCIGDHISNIFLRFGGASYEQIREGIDIDSKSIHLDAMRYEFPVKGITYWDLIITPLKQGNAVQYIVIIAKEVTEAVINRNRLEEQTKTIHEKNQQLQAIFDNVSDGLYIEDYSQGGKTVMLNKVTKKFFESMNIPEENPILIEKFEFFDKDDRAIDPENLPISRLKRGEKYEQALYTLKTCDRETHLSVSGTPLYDLERNLKMAILCVQHVTDRVNREKELQHQRDLYYNIFDTLGLPILYLTYPKLKLYDLNKKACSIIEMMIRGTDLEREVDNSIPIDDEFLERLLAYTVSDTKKVRRYFREMEVQKATVFGNLEILNGEGKGVYKLVLQPITNTNNEINEVLITAMDITNEIEQKNAIEKISKLKDELVYTITHEFKTPLTVINSAIQAIELFCWSEMPIKAKEYVKKIKQNAFRQLKLVNNLLDVNKLSIGKMKLNVSNMDIVKATRLITESVQVYAQQKEIKLIFSSSVESRIMGFDDEKYERVLLNLLSNAIKFTPRGKSIYIRVSLKRHRKKLMACIEVEDEGIGIPKDKFDLIFERFGQVDSFLTRSVEGSGLGLSLAKQMVEALGGEIIVQSRLGKGSTFSVFLPAIKAQANSNKENTSILKNQLLHITAMEFSDLYLNPQEK
ncbi:MAG: HAMP domain-containing histidine kinase [Clostridiaceae bacterium]|nr:HAMP domain-containing histidine kinase [Clostridiaceae bacterium]